MKLITLFKLVPTGTYIEVYQNDYFVATLKVTEQKVLDNDFANLYIDIIGSGDEYYNVSITGYCE